MGLAPILALPVGVGRLGCWLSHQLSGAFAPAESESLVLPRFVRNWKRPGAWQAGSSGKAHWLFREAASMHRLRGESYSSGFSSSSKTLCVSRISVLQHQGPQANIDRISQLPWLPKTAPKSQVQVWRETRTGTVWDGEVRGPQGHSFDTRTGFPGHTHLHWSWQGALSY